LLIFQSGENRMRIAIVSDIHGNRTAFEAVLADLRQTSPDLILHGGDLAQGGSSPGEVVDRIRDLGWQGVLGNTDELLFRPESLKEFARQVPKLQPLCATIEEMAAFARDALGEQRLSWLRSLPLTHVYGPLALVHASPDNCWRSPMPEASDAELQSVYASLGQPVAVYGHIHRSYIRRVGEMTVVNTGSVSLSYDGDRRAAYLLLDDAKPIIRRVEYEVTREIQALYDRAVPHAGWVAKTLERATPQAPTASASPLAKR
jgi:predicted phosphodiesterase